MGTLRMPYPPIERESNTIMSLVVLFFVGKIDLQFEMKTENIIEQIIGFHEGRQFPFQCTREAHGKAARWHSGESRNARF